MNARTDLELTKLLLVACDQAYFKGDMSANTPLAPLPDKTSTDPSYNDPAIYNDYPLYGWESGYVVHTTISDSEKGGKLVIYRHQTTQDIIVAFGGTDGADPLDWVANTQNVGWDQWTKLKDRLLTTLSGLKFNSEGNRVNIE